LSSALAEFFHLTNEWTAKTLYAHDNAMNATTVRAPLETHSTNSGGDLPATCELKDHLADRLMTVAESRSVDTLGAACQREIEQFTGSPAVGLYLLEPGEPELVYSRNVEDGFLDNYKTGFWKRDPLLDCILTRGCTIDGESLTGSQHWPGSTSFELLQCWGFSHNMGGPLRCEDKIIGVLFTASRDADAPYTPLLRQHMAMLCRAGSLALTNMVSAGHLDRHPKNWLAVSDLPATLTAAALSERLPRRSAEVATRVCRGQTNKEIARELGISDHTVKEHVGNLCKRFGVHNRTELATFLWSETYRQ
jgi:DNA-binding CsgD family transcriptional regulator